MTKVEFEKEYQKLEQQYPYEFGNQFKMPIVWNAVKDLKIEWWRALVYRIILSANPKFNIDEAARGERLAVQKIQHTEDMLALEQKAHSKIGDALTPLLKENKSSSLWELVKKQKEKK